MARDLDPSDIDRQQPWQTQYAERLSRGLNRRSPYVRRQIRLLLVATGALVGLVVVLFVVSMLG